MIRHSHFKRDKSYWHLNFGYPAGHTDMPERWQWAAQNFESLVRRADVQVHSLVVMGTHLHALISSDASVSKSELKQKIICQFDLSGQPSKGLSLEKIMGLAYYVNAYKYIYRNPVEAHLVERVEEYPFSSLRLLLGKSRPQDPVWIADNMSVIHNPIKILRWLNGIEEIFEGFLFEE